MKKKSEILTYFSDLDEKTLNRLYDYSKTVKMLYPDEDLLLNANMPQMMRKADELSALYLPSWTDKSDGDFGQFLVELIALFSEKDYWYNNAFSQEGNLSTMSMYRNIYTRAVEYGYDPILLTAPKMTFAVNFPALESIPDSSDGTVIPPGSLVIKSRTSSEEFTNAEQFIVPHATIPFSQNVTLHQGSAKTEYFDFNGDSILINSRNIDPHSVKVTINGISWTKVPQFGLSSSVNRDYVVLPEENGGISIYFGDGVYGAKPELSTSVEVFYIVTNGVDTTFSANSSFIVVNSFANRLADTVVAIDSASSGGKKSETKESIRNNAPLISRTRNTIINTKDTKDFLQAKPDISKASAQFINTTVVLYALSSEGDSLSSTRKSELISEVSSLSVQLGYTFIFGAPSFVPFPDIDLVIECVPQADFAAIKASASQATLQFFNPLSMGDFGKDFDHDNFYLHLNSLTNQIVRIRFLDRVTGQLVTNNIPLNDNEIFETPVVNDGDPNQNIFIQVKSI